MKSVAVEDQLVKDMSVFLYDDFKEGLTFLIHNDCQYIRRSVVRSLFASIDSVIFGMKEEIFNRKDKAISSFTPGELAIIEEKSFSLDKNGNVIEYPKYLELKKNIRFVFRAYGKCYGTTLEIDTDNIEWRNFLELIKVRNRITHPKAKSDLFISDDEIEKSKIVFNWFSKQHSNSIHVTTKALENATKTLKNQISKIK